MVLEFVRAFTLIFFAEMGDKSQILAMTFASRYKIRNVIIGISLGIFLNHSLAVLIGVFIPNLFNIEYLSFIAGIIFIVFGLMALNVTEDVDDVKTSKVGINLTIAFAIFIGELGDKTQLSAIVLASETQYPLLILASTVSAMILTSMVGIFIGIKFGSKIPDFILKVVSSFIFIFFGVLKVVTSIPSSWNSPLLITGLSVVLLVSYTVLFIRFRKRYVAEQSLYKQRAEELRNYYVYIKDKLETICLGTDVCSSCQGEFCLLGYVKLVVRRTLNHKPITPVDLTKKVRKDYDRSKIEEALTITLDVLKDNWTNAEYHNLHEIRYSLELLLYDQMIQSDSYQEYKNKKISIQ